MITPSVGFGLACSYRNSLKEPLMENQVAGRRMELS